MPETVDSYEADWHGPGDRWEVGVWGNNLTNQFHLTSAYDV